MRSGHALPTTLTEWLAYIEALHSKEIELGLARVRCVAERLGLQPDFPIITVAGTNGKGSTCAMLAEIYHRAGYRVACYSSPHLLSYLERIRIQQHMVSETQACKAFAAVEQARADTALTYFEYGTLAAVWLFQQEQVDVAILEVGMGGRLDAVNVFDPDCSIVTSVDLDHMAFLGDTREAIGYEKAGIFRAHKPAICADRDAPHSLVQHAQAIQAPLERIGQHFDYQAHDTSWDFSSRLGDLTRLPRPALLGDFQLENASAVMMAIQHLQGQLPTSIEAIGQGLSSVRLAGRFEVLLQQPMVIADVAHNPHAAKALASQLASQPCQGKTIAVMAMLADKDRQQVVQCLMPEIDIWHIAELQHPRAASLALMQQSLEQACVLAGCAYSDRVWSHQNIQNAYHQAYKQAGENDRIIVFGSFFTVAAIMRILLD